MMIKQLICFVEVCKTLHFTEASKNLHISQPSLSYSIKQLEDELGVELFVRDGKTILLSEYGKVFKTYADSAISILEQGKSKMKELSTPDILNVNMGYVYSTGSNLVPNIIENFYSYSGSRSVNFDLKMGTSPEIINNVIEGKSDFGVVPLLNKNIENISFIEIDSQELFLIVNKNHPLSNKKYVEIDDIDDEKLVVLYQDSDLFKLTIKLFEDNSLEPNVMFYVDELNSMAAFVSVNMGVGITPIIPTLSTYSVKAIPFKNKITRDIYIVWNTNNENSLSVKSLLDFLKSRHGLYFLYEI